MKAIILVLGGICILLTVSCNKEQFRNDIPAYITINTYEIDSIPGALPLATTNVQDAWVSVNGELQGAFELPASFPVAKTGKSTIRIQPGVLKSGISTLRGVYPFYTDYEITNYELVAGEDHTLTPSLTYRDDLSIFVAWKEDFEEIGSNLLYHIDSDTVVVQVEDSLEAIQGNHYGVINMEENDAFFELYSITLTDLPDNGTPVFLEMDYKTNHFFFVGLYSDNRTVQESLYGYRAQDEKWNKLYIDFTASIFNKRTSEDFNIFIGFQKDPNIPEVTMKIDNIKLLHL